MIRRGEIGQHELRAVKAASDPLFTAFPPAQSSAYNEDKAKWIRSSKEVLSSIQH